MRHVQFLAGMIFVLLLLLAAGLGPNPASTVRADAGTWASTGPHERIYALAIDPANNQIVYATGESGLWETRDGGISWMKLSDSQLTRLVIDPGAVHTLYAVSRDGHTILKSTNGGSEWQVVYQGSLTIATIALDPNRPTHIYAGGDDLISLPMGGGSEGLAQLLASTDGGKTWTQILPPSLQGMPENANSVTQLVLLPGLPGVLIINVAFHKSWGGPGGQNPANPGVLALSRDAGASWSSIGTHWDQRTGGSPRGTFLDALAVGGHAIDHLTFYAGYGLTRSDDGGQTWINLQPLLPGSQQMTTLLMDPRQTDWITIGILEADGTVRLYTSIDRGEQWIDIGALDRPRRLMGWQSLVFAPTTRTFYAATDNGVYQSRLL